MGLRRKLKHYDYEMLDFELPGGDVVHFANWLNPCMEASVAPQAFSRSVIESYQELLEEGDFCIDIGAHCGDTTIPMGIAVGKTGCVLGLEPNPYVYHVLEKNVRANNHIANIKTMMAAAGPKQEFMEFEYSDPGFCNGGRHEGISAVRHGHPYKLPVFCVDLQKELQDHFQIELNQLKFVKVDAEGYDLTVLQSILGIIETYRPVVKAEIFKKTSQQYRRDLLALFENRDYVVHEIIEEPFKPGARLMADNLARPKTYDIICFPQ